MSRFLAVHSVAFTEVALAGLAKSEATKFKAKGVAWFRTYCDFDDNKHFCEWEAPNKGEIEQILKKLEIPFDAIYPVLSAPIVKLVSSVPSAFKRAIL